MLFMNEPRVCIYLIIYTLIQLFGIFDIIKCNLELMLLRCVFIAGYLTV